MKASSAAERWLRERAEREATKPDQGRDQRTVQEWMERLYANHRADCERLDAAERRLLACSETAQEHAAQVVVTSLAWHHEPERIEALAAVAEDVDRRAPFDEHMDEVDPFRQESST